MKCDVFILGGGPAGTAAALGAAWSGADVILAERTFRLGGCATGALVAPLQTFHSPAGRIIGGAGQRIIDELKRAGATPGHLPDPVGFAPSVTPVDPDALKLILQRMLAEAGVKVLFGHFLREAKSAGGRVTGVTLEDACGGAVEIESKQFIDASGNGDMAFAAGANMEVDENCQPMSLMFIMENVDEAAIVKYRDENPTEFYVPEGGFPKVGYTGVSGFFSHVAAARKEGRLTLPRDRVLLFGTTRRGAVTINTTRITGKSGLSGKDLSEAMSEGLRQAAELEAFLKSDIPGFQSARICRVADMVGVRETRRLIGRVVLNENDLVESRRFDDCVAKGGYPLDMHLPNSDGLKSVHIGGDGHYDIPLRALLCAELENLLTAGKCISVTHEGFSSTRVMPACMATGHAAGAAAALAARSGGNAESLSAEIQKTLREQGAILRDEDIVKERLGAAI